MRSGLVYGFALNDVSGLRVATAYLVCQVAVSCTCMCQQFNRQAVRGQRSVLDRHLHVTICM